VAELVSDCVFVQPAPEYLLPIAEVIPLQLFAYYMALERGVNVDRPRTCPRQSSRRCRRGLRFIAGKHAQGLKPDLFF